MKKLFLALTISALSVSMATSAIAHEKKKPVAVPPAGAGAAGAAAGTSGAAAGGVVAGTGLGVGATVGLIGAATVLAIALGGSDSTATTTGK